MKCSKCGKEFGEGVNCQSCGIDRVTGLGNYSGYNNSTGNNGYNSSGYGNYTSSKTSICYACNEIIPLGATFCPVCGKKLLVTCPKCGHEYSSLYPVCSKCGTNRDVYYKQKEAEKQKAIREEQERQRKQREWEQSPEGKAELERKEETRKRNRVIIMIARILCFGGIFIISVKQDVWGVIMGFGLIAIAIICFYVFDDI